MKMKQVTLKVEGMKCNDCKLKVANAIATVNGVEIAIVDLTKKEVVVTGAAEAIEVIKAIETAGYYVSLTKF